MVQENADSTVLQDIKNFLNKIAPEWHFHIPKVPTTCQHILRHYSQTNITLSLKKKLILGTWQGIFLIEHRKQNSLGMYVSFRWRIGWFYFHHQFVNLVKECQNLN